MDEVAEPHLDTGASNSSEEERVNLKCLRRNTRKRARVISPASSSAAEEELTRVMPQQTRLQGVQVEIPIRGKRRASTVPPSDEEDYDLKRFSKRGKWVHTVLLSASSSDAEETATRS